MMTGTTSRIEAALTAPTTQKQPVPPLRHGECLTREEFERRYEHMPNLKHTELINGVVSMSSPLHLLSHARPHSSLVTWLGVYRALTPGLMIGDNATVRLGASDEVQPDAILLIASGGTARIGKDDYVEGPPELVVEVAATSSEYDFSTKRTLYQNSGVQEYLLWRTLYQRIDWWELHNGVYVSIPTSADGVVQSRVFPGLWLDVAAILDDHMSSVLATLHQGMATTAYHAFVQRQNNP